MGRSEPSAAVTLSMTLAGQRLPPLATVAKAPAIAIGEMLSLPMTSFAFAMVISLPSPVVTPIFFTTLAMSHRSSSAAMAR